jgi:CMP-N-acetylneuraminic acid synthetase
VVPTSPFIAPETITRAVKMLVDQQLDSVVGVRIERRYAWRNGQPAYLRADGSIPNSGDLAAEIRETTGLYVNTRAAVLENRRRISPRCAPIALSALEAIDIDYEEDFALAELVATGLAARSLEGSTDAVHAGCYRR